MLYANTVMQSQVTPRERRESATSSVASLSYGAARTNLGRGGGGGGGGGVGGGVSLEMLAMSDSDLSENDEDVRVQMDLTLIGEADESGTPSSEEEGETPPQSGDEGGEKALEMLAMSDSELDEEKQINLDDSDDNRDVIVEEQEEEEEEQESEKNSSLQTSSHDSAASCPSVLQLGSSVGSLSASTDDMIIGEGTRRVSRKRKSRKSISSRSRYNPTQTKKEEESGASESVDMQSLLKKVSELEKSHRELQEAFEKERTMLWASINRQAQTIHLMSTTRAQDQKKMRSHYRDFQHRLDSLQRGNMHTAAPFQRSNMHTAAPFQEKEYFV